jgi:hypothetical protein
MLRVLDRLLPPTSRRSSCRAIRAKADDDERHRYRWGYHWGAELEAVLVAASTRGQSTATAIDSVRYRDLAAAKL